MTDMAVPLVVSSHGYGLFVDNTFQQDWNFAWMGADGNRWQVGLRGGGMNFYFIRGDAPADLDHYTQMTDALMPRAGRSVTSIEIRLPQLGRDVRGEG